MRNNLRCVSALLLLSLALSGCNRAQPPLRVQWLSMGTTAAVMAPPGQPERLAQLRAIAGATLDEIESDLSIFRSNSVVSAINAAAGSGLPVAMSGNAAACITMARCWAEASGGAFDPTVGPLMDTWGFRKTRVTAMPADTAIAEAMARCGWRGIIIQTNEFGAADARLARPGMRLDLGGIAKGYAVDVAYDRMRSDGKTDFMIDLGGNIRVHGAVRRSSHGWRVGIRDPFNSGRIIGTMVLTNGQAVATSGNYEQFVEINHTRYTHIIDPRTGWPVRGMAGVTVVAPTAAQADALSTAFFVMGPEEGQRLLRQLPGCHALWVPDDQTAQIIFSDAFREALNAEIATGP